MTGGQVWRDSIGICHATVLWIVLMAMLIPLAVIVAWELARHEARHS